MAEKCLSKNAMLKNLETCLSYELKALDLYEELLPILDNDIDRIKIKMVARDEKEHIEIVKDLLRIIDIYYQEK